MWSEGRQGGGCLPAGQAGVKDMGKEARPAAVAGKPKQAGEAHIRERWGWAEPSVWTERMLTALEEGVKGGKWFSLAKCILCRTWAVHTNHSPCSGLSIPMWEPLTGEPDAGDPPVRFGGRGGNRLPYPYQSKICK